MVRRLTILFAGALSIAVSSAGYAWCVSETGEWMLTGLVYWGSMMCLGLASSAYIDSRS